MVCAPVRRDNPRALARGLSTVQAHKSCSISLVPQDYRPYRRTNHGLSLTCTTITSVDLAHHGVSRAKDLVSVDCGTRNMLLGLLNLF